MIGIIKPLIQGLAITFKYFFKKPITLRYPQEKRTPHERFRGAQQLLKDENGKLKCVACFLCATACPAECIYIEPGEDEEHNKYPKVFEIDLGRCIFCGLCEQACPKEAIRMTRDYELAVYERKEMKYDIERLAR
jgi:NADH-quinone oxidoreductase chain I